METRLNEAKEQLRKECDGRKVEIATLQLTIDKCHDTIQRLHRVIHNTNLEYSSTWSACENELIQVIRTTFATVTKKSLDDQHSNVDG